MSDTVAVAPSALSLSDALGENNPLAKYFPKPQVNYENVGEKHEKFLKKVYVQTWGCQMNVADTERMLTHLGRLNYRPTEEPSEADFILLNTCHIREKARHKLVSRVGELRGYKQSKPDLILAISGCVAQAEAKALSEELPWVDLIFGPDQIEDLPKLLSEAQIKADGELKEGWDAFHSHHEPIVRTGFKKDEGYSLPSEDTYEKQPEAQNYEVSRFVNIIKGCNNFCTFCVVPYTRGREKSRALEEILVECKNQIKNGAKEIILLGQNVNSWGIDFLPSQEARKNAVDTGHLPFADLLTEVGQLPGLERIRFTTSNPHDFTPSLAEAFAKIPLLADQFHLPVQSGSNAVLDRMNRQYTREQYLERVGWIRKVRPQMQFGTDIIVGFPGETEADFDDTMDIVEKMQYGYIFAFKYSQRKGTPATRFSEQIPENVMDKRLQKLLDTQKSITLRLNLAEIGKEHDVLVLYRHSKESNAYYGRTFDGRLVKIPSGRNLVGLSVRVSIQEANATSLVGHLLGGTL